MKTMQTVFVYGTLKKDHGRSLHDMVGASLQGSDITLPRFSMWNLGPFPAVSFKGNKCISGEVWLVNQDVMNYLDFIEGYPNFYSREKIKTQEIPGKHWIYYLHPHQINPHPQDKCPEIKSINGIVTWKGSGGVDFGSY